MNYFMQDSNFVGLPKRSELFLNIQLSDSNKFVIQRNNWFLLRKLFCMYI